MPDNSEKHRVSRVTTRTGDQGETGLADGSRVAKDAPVIEAMGAIDELNAALGVLRGKLAPASQQHDTRLEQVQHALFDVGAELALMAPVTETTKSPYLRVTAQAVALLDQATAQLNAALPPLKEFVLPAGSPATSWCHFTRTLARKAERRWVSLQKDWQTNPATLQFLNRLSDYLFVLARTLEQETNGVESCWRND